MLPAKKMFIGILSESYKTAPYSHIDLLNKSLNIIYDPTIKSYLAISDDAAYYILTNPDIFSTKPLADRAEPVMRGKVLAQMEGDEHKVKRKMFLRHLTGKMIKEYHEPLLLQLCNSLINDIKNKKSFDFISEFGSKYALLTTFNIIGIHQEKFSWFLERLRLIVKFATGFNLSDESQRKALLASEQLASAIMELIDERKKHPNQNGDILSFILNENKKQPIISDSEIIALSLNILLAASEPVDKILANCIYHLYRKNEYIEKLMAGTCNYIDIVQESLRLTPPVHLIPRAIEKDSYFEGVELTKGEIIYALIPSANRDEKYFENPNIFDPLRKSHRHLSYGAGVHACVGAQFANTQLCIALKTLVPVLRNYKEVSCPRFEGVYTRGATEYHLKRI